MMSRKTKIKGSYRIVMVLRKWYIKLIDSNGRSSGALGPYKWKEITRKELKHVERLGYVEENEHGTQQNSSADSTNNRTNR